MGETLNERYLASKLMIKVPFYFEERDGCRGANRMVPPLNAKYSYFAAALA